MCGPASTTRMLLLLPRSRCRRRCSSAAIPRGGGGGAGQGGGSGFPQPNHQRGTIPRDGGAVGACCVVLALALARPGRLLEWQQGLVRAAGGQAAGQERGAYRWSGRRPRRPAAQHAHRKRLPLRAMPPPACSARCAVQEAGRAQRAEERGDLEEAVAQLKALDPLLNLLAVVPWMVASQVGAGAPPCSRVGHPRAGPSQPQADRLPAWVTTCLPPASQEPEQLEKAKLLQSQGVDKIEADGKGGPWAGAALQRGRLRSAGWEGGPLCAVASWLRVIASSTAHCCPSQGAAARASRPTLAHTRPPSSRRMQALTCVARCGASGRGSGTRSRSWLARMWVARRSSSSCCSMLTHSMPGTAGRSTGPCERGLARPTRAVGEPTRLPVHAACACWCLIMPALAGRPSSPASL